jgi:hypothetical protein
LLWSSIMKTGAQTRFKSPAIFPAFILICQFIAVPVRAQEPPANGLNIVVVEGEGLVNIAREHAVHEPVVRVEDDSHRPIAGASVVFTLPTEDTTGVFANGSKSIIVTTGADGLAVGKGMRINLVTGKLVIHVTASFRGLSANTRINQTNEGVTGAKASAGGGHGKVIAILAVVAAAAGGGAYYATHRGNSTATTPPTGPTQPTSPAAIGITAGNSSIIGPH